MGLGGIHATLEVRRGKRGRLDVCVGPDNSWNFVSTLSIDHEKAR